MKITLTNRFEIQVPDDIKPSALRDLICQLIGASAASPRRLGADPLDPFYRAQQEIQELEGLSPARAPVVAREALPLFDPTLAVEDAADMPFRRAAARPFRRVRP